MADVTLNLPKELTLIDEEILASLGGRASALRERWQSAKPFHYVVIDDFLPPAVASAIHDCYPMPDIEGWDKKTYTHQKKKFSMRTGFPAPIDDFFRLSATDEFKSWLTAVTSVEKLIDDPELLGGGLHEILRGGFLDVHVDYNFHPRTKLHRRINVLLYMNRDWQPDYEGYLQLWDMTANRRVEDVAPIYNRAVIFETNEVSFHGHPVPLNSPQNRTRNSLALYYYTKDRETVVAEHNTLYKQTSGVRGRAKTLISSLQALSERVSDQGALNLAVDIKKKLSRRLRGLPPENK